MAKIPENLREMPDAPVLTISQAAVLAHMHAQTLRQYDRLGLVKPHRTRGHGRRYSYNHVLKLRHIQMLSQEKGINLAGIEIILSMEKEIRYLRDMLALGGEVPRHRIFAADASGAEGVTVTYEREEVTGHREVLVRSRRSRAVVIR